LFKAKRGGGAYRNDVSIAVSQVESLADSVLATGFPYDSWTCPEDPALELGRLLRKVVTVRCDGSAALDLCNVACGRIDGYWERRLAPWDMAAGSLIVQEAGGRVTTITGSPFTIHANSIVASGAGIHKEMIAVLGGFEGP
jgi:myo-inositol-1(or 4)-monophosphatase